MEKPQFIGIVLMVGLLVIYFQFIMPSRGPIPPPPSTGQLPGEPGAGQDPALRVAPGDSLPLSTDPVDSAALKLRYGHFYPLATGKSEQIKVENDKLEVEFSSQGGVIQSVRLKEYSNFDGGPLELFGAGHDWEPTLRQRYSSLRVKDLFFRSRVENGADTIRVIFSAQVPHARLIQSYHIPKQGYSIFYKCDYTDERDRGGFEGLDIAWEARLPRHENNLKDERGRTMIRHYSEKEGHDHFGKGKVDQEQESLTGKVHWVSLNQKFFTAALVSPSGMDNTVLSQKIVEGEEVKWFGIKASLPPGPEGQFAYSFFFGPNDYQILQAVTDEFSQNLELGWWMLTPVNTWLILPIFRFLKAMNINYGVIIILMVLIIRILLSPLTYKSHMGMAKMKVLKPELDEIKKRNEGDSQKAQVQQMDLYRKVGINPLSGCIPVVLQFPILVSLFYFIPSAIEFRMYSFLWADDLSTYDSILDLPFSIPFYGSHVSLFTLLMSGSTFLYTMSSMQVSTIQSPVKTMQYLMPFMLLFFFNSFPSGLSYYYFLSNLVSYLQMLLFRRLTDETKILKALEDNKAKNINKKKSPFQSRFEEAMKARKSGGKEDSRVSQKELPGQRRT